MDFMGFEFDFLFWVFGDSAFNVLMPIFYEYSLSEVKLFW